MRNFDNYYMRANILMFGGLIAISLIILQDYISLEHLDIPVTISVIAFAISLPCLAFSILIENVRKEFNPTISHAYRIILSSLYLTGVFVNLIGIGAAIWHIMRIAGILFAISGVIGLVILAMFEQNATKQAKEEAEAENQQE